MFRQVRPQLAHTPRGAHVRPACFLLRTPVLPRFPPPHASCDQVSGTVTVVTATPPVVTMEHWRELRTRLHTMKARLGDYSKDVADALLSQ